MTRVFFISARLPYPMESGPDFRTWMIVTAVAGEGPVGVFGISHRQDEAVPDLDYWGSSSRRAALAHNRNGLGDGTWVKNPAWRPSDWYYHPAIEEELEAALASFRPDIVVLEQLGMAGYLPLARRHASGVVLNNHNVETDLQRQLATAELSPVTKMVRRQFADRTELLERETVADVDQVWVCSDLDRSLLRNLFGTDARVIPNAIRLDDYGDLYAGRIETAIEGPRLIFPAQFAYLPNDNAAMFLLAEILPAILRSHSGASLVLAGRDPSDRIIEAARGLPVTVTGPVPSMRPFLEVAEVMVIPLQQGSGTRLKAVEGFAAGLPVISTPKGVEGLGLEAGVHYLAAETPGDFSAALQHLASAGVAGGLRRAAHEFVHRRLSTAAMEEAVSAALRDTVRAA